eukprot:997972-Pelagomonas_calceolata.AAC.2
MARLAEIVPPTPRRNYVVNDLGTLQGFTRVYNGARHLEVVCTVHCVVTVRLRAGHQARYLHSI